MLGLFNLLPIPPLDGGRIAVGLLPRAAGAAWARLERAGIVLVLLAGVPAARRCWREFGIAFDPFGVAGLHAVGDPIFDALDHCRPGMPTTFAW